MLYYRQLVAFLSLGCVSLLSTTVGFAIAWLRTRERAIRAELRTDRPPLSVADRDDQLRQAIESIALEVERISEGQRFTTRLLSESRAPTSHTLPRESGRVNTPH